MERRVLYALVFLASVTGLFLIPAKDAKVSQLKATGTLYRVCGTLVPLKEIRNGCLYRLVDDSGEVKAVAFFGRCLAGYTCVYGRLESYRGEPELVVLAYG